MNAATLLRVYFFNDRKPNSWLLMLHLMNATFFSIAFRDPHKIDTRIVEQLLYVQI